MADWIVAPGESVPLQARDTGSTEGAPGRRRETQEALDSVRADISQLQRRLWAEHRRSLLVVLQAMDTAGKDSTIRHIFSGINPAGVRVTPFGVPTAQERGHDFLWRIHRAAPGAGEIGIFNRSHYEDVLVVRVKSLVPEAVWQRRYDLINNFERQLAHGGTRVLKFFLHISKQEQAKRLQRRLDNPDKRWKFSAADLRERRLWDDYQLAYQEAIERTSTETAPWFVIPSDTKWYRNWAVATVILETLKDMDPQFPEPADFDPDLKID